MRTIQILLMRLGDGYRAVAQGFGMLDTDTLEGFHDRIRNAIVKQVGSESIEFEFALAADLRSWYPACPPCGGAERVERARIAAQYRGTAFASIVWSNEATT